GDITGSIVIDASAVNTSVVGSYTVTYNVSDANGNAATQVTRTVNVVDSTAPIPNITNLPDITGQCTATATAPTATDGCFGSITGTTTDLTTYNAQGTYTITWIYTDGQGNTSSQNQTVIIDDTTPPTITCPSNINTANDAGLCSAIVTYVAPTGSDNCGAITVTQIAGLASGSAFPVGTTTNTFEI